MQHTATHCTALQHTATHCNTLRNTATHCDTGLANVYLWAILTERKFLIDWHFPHPLSLVFEPVFEDWRQFSRIRGGEVGKGKGGGGKGEEEEGGGEEEGEEEGERARGRREGEEEGGGGRVAYDGVLQCVAVCCSVLQSVAECCSELQ